MYSQFQQYQNQNQNASSTQQNLAWNGTAWVPNHAQSANSSYSTYNQQQNQYLQSSPQKNPVQMYTDYYHGWQSHLNEQTSLLGSVPFSNAAKRAGVQSSIDWAKFYADQSSRAAHHFYQSPNATSLPFEAPPAPPTSLKVSPPPAQSAVAPAPSSGDNNTPGSLTRYVRRCLDLCSTSEQKKTVQAEVEKRIAVAIQQKTLHSKNWDLEPLVTLPGTNPAPSLSPRVDFSTGRRNMHAPGLGGQSLLSPHTQIETGSKMRRSTSYGSKLPQNDSYYGHGGSTSTSPPSARGISSPPKSWDSSPMGSHSHYGPASRDVYTVRTDDEFISLQPKQKKLKTKKSHSDHGTKGLDRSAAALAKRANRFSGAGGIHDVAHTNSTSASAIDHAQYMGKKTIGGTNKKLCEDDYERMTVKGTCQTMEKEYLRLTAPPRAELVRPQPVLEKWMAALKKQYAAGGKKDYLWFCSQLKAVRQDCTVQRIQGSFAVDVYETHARIALQEGDLNEYNQCQTQLKELYQICHDDSRSVQNQEEFISYRILYYLFLSTNEKYDGGSSDMFKIMLSLTDKQRQNPAVAHALRVREAFALGNYFQFFRLHASNPHLGRFLTERIVPAMRYRGLQRIVKAYRPSVEADFALRQLGFEDSEHGRVYLERCGCLLDDRDINTKDSRIHEPDSSKTNSLI